MNPARRMLAEGECLEGLAHDNPISEDHWIPVALPPPACFEKFSLARSSPNELDNIRRAFVSKAPHCRGGFLLHADELIE